MQSKLHVLKLQSAYTLFEDGKQIHIDHGLIADLQVVQRGDAAETYELVSREMRSVGAHVWSDVAADVASGKLQSSELDIAYIINTDAGPDEIGFRNSVCAEVENVDCITVWQVNCFKHQYQLIVADGLSLVDSFLAACNLKYFTSLAKLSLCWRADARPFFSTWEHLFGDSSALHCAKTLPPKAVSGRWGSVAEQAAYHLRAQLRRVGLVAREVWRQRSNSKRKPAARDAIDDEAGLATEHYREKVGRWRQDVLHICEVPILSATIAVMHHCRGPLTHFYNLLGAPSKDGGTKLYELIGGRANDFLAEFHRVVDDDEFWTQIACTDGLEPHQLESLRELGCDVASVYAAAFRCRICDVVWSLPWRCFLL